MFKFEIRASEDALSALKKNELPLFLGESIGHVVDGVYFGGYGGHTGFGSLVLTNFRACYILDDSMCPPFDPLSDVVIKPTQDEIVPATTPFATDLFINGSISRHQSRPHDIHHVLLPLGLIEHVAKVGGKSTADSSPYGIDITTKDLRILRFRFSPDSDRKMILSYINIHAYPLSSQEVPLFAFVFAERQFSTVPGWGVFSPESEYSRLGVGSDDCKWRHSRANEHYALCETYPSYVVVPVSVSDEDLSACARFRSKGRFVALSWLHPVTQAAIVRSSQPCVGLTFKRCPEDESVAYDIARSAPATACDPRLVILDSRPMLNAFVNQAMGQGYESASYYPYCDLQFMDIKNIHVVRDSFQRLRDLINHSVPEQGKWLTAIENTGWLAHIKLCLLGAVKVAQTVALTGTSVLVHCSDGWDRTSQASSLAMLLLDPYYRSIIGFEVLIEKEWLSFGHKFAQRTGQGSRSHNDDQRSPIFVQWIDCVWQLTRQFPEAFEFNEQLLISILDHMYAGYFGTFFGNSEAQRVKAQVREKTVSLWTMVNSNMQHYINPLYSPTGPLWPVVTARALVLWASYYCRGCPAWAIPCAASLGPSLEVQTLPLLLERARLQALLANNL